MREVRSSIVINAPAEKVFDFHTDTKNLPLIMPRWFKTEVISEEGEGKGKTIDIKMKLFGFLTNKWLVRFDEYERPGRITDLVVSGPFKYFRHERTITPTADGRTELRDRLEYELPLGILGKAADTLFMRRFVIKMFAYRQKRTKELLER
jgi:ligand-binding SRPBCC domain-containing protein